MLRGTIAERAIALITALIGGSSPQVIPNPKFFTFSTVSVAGPAARAAVMRDSRGT